MKVRMFHDLEAKGRNWHKELPSVLWALQTNVNRATRDTPFHLVYGVDVVLPLEIVLESAGVAQFNEKIKQKQEISTPICSKRSATQHYLMCRSIRNP
jgi:hypothetical protein